LPAAASSSSQPTRRGDPACIADPLTDQVRATTRQPQTISTYHEDVTMMSEEAEKARQALQESMDLRDQGHSDE
jgi:hypothetical protein